MFEKIIQFSISQRWLVMLAALAIVAIGIFNYQKLPIDAVPDITNIQVQINTEAQGFSPLEVEQRITFPIETLMSGLPMLDYTRSLSRYGLSQVTIVFNEGTNIYFARQLVAERIQEAKGNLPAGIEPSMGPISTGLGEIYMWTVEADPNAIKPDGSSYSETDLKEIQDWVIKPQLRNVKGVTEVNTIGGFTKQYHVTPSPQKLMAYSITFQDIIAALVSNNDNRGAGFIENNGEQYLIRTPGQISSIDEIESIVVQQQNGVPVRVRDIASVNIGKELRSGAATENGKEVVLGTVFMLMGENSRTVSLAVDEKMTSINQSLPNGVSANTVYNRTILVDKAIATVKKNLVEGALLVIFILFAFLGNFRAALLTALVIPLSMMFTITGMVANDVSANLMSLGALDFGIIVDGAVVIVENCIRRLAHEQTLLKRELTKQERFRVTYEASKEVRRALLFGQAIIMVVYLPIFTLTGVEGKMFTPMAFTVVSALVGAAILSVTFIPAGVALFLKGPISEKDGVIIRLASKIYNPSLNTVLNNKSLVICIALVIITLSGLLVTKMGTEFIPSLDEGDIATHALRIPGTSLSQAIEMQKQLEIKLGHHGAVERVFTKLGTAEVASDPMPPNVADTFIMLKPRDQWPNPQATKDAVVTELTEIARNVPGNNYEFTQPIQMRFNELISGVRADVAVKIFGDDNSILLRSAQKVAELLQAIPGAADVSIEQVTGLPMLTVNIDREVASRYGLNVSQIQDVVEIAMGGVEVSQVFQGDRRFSLVVRLPETLRENIDQLETLPIALPKNSQYNGNEFIPLGAIAKVERSIGPNQISRENGKRRIVVSANVRDRDLGSFVSEAQSTIQRQANIPSGYWIDWGGQFEQMISAANRLKVVVPVALLLIFLLLFATFNTVKDGLIVFTGVPFALTGGILALWLRDIPLSISAGVGFIALSGVAVLNGLVMISFIKGLVEERIPLIDAIKQGAMARLRPVLMTALVAALGFMPMAIATGTGAEVQRPLATVVIGGILSSTLLTLLVLPVLFYLFNSRKRDVSL